MKSQHELHNEITSFQLAGEARDLLDSDAFDQHGRCARLLFEHGDLHVLMVALAPGIGMPEHSVDGTALVQALRGEAVLRAGEDAWTLAPGGLFSIAPGLDHSVETADGCVLLAIVQSSGQLRLFGPGAKVPRASSL